MDYTAELDLGMEMDFKDLSHSPRPPGQSLPQLLEFKTQKQNKTKSMALRNGPPASSQPSALTAETIQQTHPQNHFLEWSSLATQSVAHGLASQALIGSLLELQGPPFPHPDLLSHGLHVDKNPVLFADTFESEKHDTSSCTGASPGKFWWRLFHTDVQASTPEMLTGLG